MGERDLVKILLVEDDKDNIIITQKALKEAKIINQLFIVRDGQEALDFLQHGGAYKDPLTSPKPGLILLDINLPKLNGLEVLACIKTDPNLKRIPVIMLTVSKRDEDVLKSYDIGANSFLQKPVEFDEFVELVKEVAVYWTLLNVTPQ